jgi:DNA-binding CsgD family transcriptional regulator
MSDTQREDEACRVTWFRLLDTELAVASYPLPSLEVSRLTPAERELVPGLLGGISLSELARQRRRSRATVSHQVESIYRKLKVHSRSELVTLLMGLPPEDPADG